jgi:uncharacterized membrane protein YkvA (DUF1232 family)
MSFYAAKFIRLMQQSGEMNPTKLLALLVHAPNFIRLFYRLLHDSRVPFHLKALCWASIIYFISPIDILKDFPFSTLFGRMDDVLFLYFAFRKLLSDAPAEVVQEHVQAISAGR